jgi:hypothetical protein
VALAGADPAHPPPPLPQVQAGFLADLLVVKGDPLADIEVLCDERNVRVVVKGGLLAKAPPQVGELANSRLVGL